MPRALDVDARETAVVEAAWRIIATKGVRALSVRTVAAEAGMPPSSLRYTFPTQSSIPERAIALMRGRIEARVRALPDTLRGADWARAAILEMLPLDEERRIEMQVCIALGAAGFTDPAIEPLHAEFDAQIADLCREAAVALGRTADADAELLFAVVDGLALHLVSAPADADTGWALAALDRYLAG